MKKIKKQLLIGIAIGLLIIITLITITNIQCNQLASTYKENEIILRKELNEIIEEEVKNNQFSGTVLVSKDDSIVFEEGYGYSNRYFNRRQNEPLTKYVLGSTTKNFTALSTMKLKEDGLIQLDDAITKYFPEYTLWKDVTIAQLLNHTSGIKNYYKNVPNYYLGHITPLEIMDRYKDTPLLFEPGTDYDYSNTNYMILTALIEKVSSKSYPEFLKEEVLEPNNLKNTGYNDHPNHIEKMAHGYCLNMILEVQGFNLSNFYGAGGVYSTANDLYHHLRNLDETVLVNKDTMIDVNDEGEYFYGYGMMLTTNQFGKTYFITGSGPGINTGMYKYVDQDVIVVILSNSQDVDTYDLAMKLCDAATSK